MRISLSLDGGHTYPYELAASTPNDGSETVLLPNAGTVHARVKVEAVGNVFFDVSNDDFVILALPTVTSSAPDGAAVQYSDSLSPPLTVLATDPDSAGAALVASVSGLPAGLSLAPSSISDDATRPGSATWTVAGRTAAAPGTYAVTVTVTDEAGGTAATSFAIVVNAEDAEATYTGDVLAFTSPASPAADVLLRATVRDRAGEAGGADTEPGDIANATVSFEEDGATLCGPLPLVLLDGKTSGSASCSVPLWPGAHSIDAVVGGFYSGTSTSVIEIDDPEGSAVSGAGSILASRSAGAYAADPGSHVEFGLSVKYKVREKDDRDDHDDRDKNDERRKSREPQGPQAAQRTYRGAAPVAREGVRHPEQRPRPSRRFRRDAGGQGVPWPGPQVHRPVGHALDGKPRGHHETAETHHPRHQPRLAGDGRGPGRPPRVGRHHRHHAVERERAAVLVGLVGRPDPRAGPEDR